MNLKKKNHLHHVKENPAKIPRGNAYNTWNNMWKIVTAIPKEQQAIVVLLESLEGNAKAEKAVSELTAIDVNIENQLI